MKTLQETIDEIRIRVAVHQYALNAIRKDHQNGVMYATTFATVQALADLEKFIFGQQKSIVDWEADEPLPAIQK